MQIPGLTVTAPPKAALTPATAAPAADHPLQPSLEGRFSSARARKLIADALRDQLKGVSYTPDASASTARELADVIRERMKGVLLTVPSELNGCQPATHVNRSCQQLPAAVPLQLSRSRYN
jgi:hypothetical protein